MWKTSKGQSLLRTLLNEEQPTQEQMEFAREMAKREVAQEVEDGTFNPGASMVYSEYRFDQDAIADLVKERSETLRTVRGFSNLLAFGLRIVADRLSRDTRRYRDYGPWWPALKAVMNRNGYNLGSQSDPFIEKAYSFKEDVQTLVAADEFRTMYLRNFVIYTNEFMLDGTNGKFWTLYDSDMEEPTT
jgi:hypothetical protein